MIRVRVLRRMAVVLAPLTLLGLFAPWASATDGSAVSASASGTATQRDVYGVTAGTGAPNATPDGVRDFPCATQGPVLANAPAGCTWNAVWMNGDFAGLALSGMFRSAGGAMCAGLVGTATPVPFSTKESVASGYGLINATAPAAFAEPVYGAPVALNGVAGTCPAGFASLVDGTFVRSGNVAQVEFALKFADGSNALVSGSLNAVPAAPPCPAGDTSCSAVSGTVSSNP